MSDLFKFFRGDCNKFEADAKKLEEQFAPKGITITYMKEAFAFFRGDCNKFVDDSLKLVDQWWSHPLGAIPISFTKVLFKFFRGDCNKFVDDSIQLVLKFYAMTEGSGALPSYAELEEDVPKFFKFFRGDCNKFVDDSLKLVEGIVKGNGRVRYDTFVAAFKEARASKFVDDSLKIAFEKVGLQKP